MDETHLTGQGYRAKNTMNPKLIPLLIVPPLLGWLFLHLGLRKSQLPLKNLFSFLLAPAAGFAIISLSLFICYVLQPQHARLITALLPWLYIFILMVMLSFKLSSTAGKQNLPGLIQSYFSLNGPFTPSKILHILLNWILLALMIYTFADFIRHVANYMTWNAHGGWDARYFWHLKARFLVRDPEQWRLMFSEYLRWGNNDYPLMVPGVIAWGWHFMGREILLWPMIVALVFVCSLGCLIIWYLAAWCSWFSAVTAGVFFFTMPAYIFWGGTMYCDIPYAFFSNTALLLLLSGLRLKDRRVLALSAFFAGCSTFTKNEGFLFLGCYGLLAFCSLCHLRKNSLSEVFRDFSSLCLGIVLPLCVSLYFKTAVSDQHNNIITIKSSADFIDAIQNEARIRVIFEGFYLYLTDAENWNGLWLLAIGSLLYWPLSRRLSPLPYSGILFVGIVLINLGYLFIFTISPQNIYRHIETALMRLLLQTGALALVFVFETFGFRRQKNVGSPKV